MKLKIMRTTVAIDEEKELDEMVNEFCSTVNVIDINCQTEDGETYVYIKYLDKCEPIYEDYCENQCCCPDIPDSI